MAPFLDKPTWWYRERHTEIRCYLWWPSSLWSFLRYRGWDIPVLKQIKHTWALFDRLYEWTLSRGTRKGCAGKQLGPTLLFVRNLPHTGQSILLYGKVTQWGTTPTRGSDSGVSLCDVFPPSLLTWNSMAISNHSCSLPYLAGASSE